jgi:hypothetical protein
LAVDSEEILLEEAAETEESDAQEKMGNARDGTVGVAQNVITQPTGRYSSVSTLGDARVL